MVALNVLTLNLRKETEEDGVNNWPIRKDLVVRLIQEILPHVFGTQEGRRQQIFGLLDPLDRIPASPDVHTRNTGILLTSYEGRYPSDHFPVRATLELGGSGPSW